MRIHNQTTIPTTALTVLPPSAQLWGASSRVGIVVPRSIVCNDVKIFAVVSNIVSSGGCH